MKQKQIVDAFKALNRLGQQEVRWDSQLKIYNLQQELAPAYQFHQESEEKILSRFPYKTATNEKNGYTTFSYEKIEDAEEARKLFTELNEMDNPIEFTRITITGEDGFRVTLDDLKALHPFVDFKLKNVSAE